MSDCARTEERLVDYLEGVLPPHEHEALDAHATGCRACSAVLRESRSILEAYRSVPDADVGAEIAGKLLAAARLQPVGKHSRRSTWVLVAAAAVVLVSAVVGVLWFDRAGPADPIASLLREAEAHIAAGEAEAALTAYEQALDLAGEDEREAEILCRLGALHVAAGDFARALARLGLVISTHPDYAGLETVLLLRGRALEGLGEREQALALYRVVAAEFPGARDEALRKISALERQEPDPSYEELQTLGYGGDGGD